MDLIIAYRHSRWHDLELKYALRSIEKYLKHDRVYIIGDKPEWIKEFKKTIGTNCGEVCVGGLFHIPAADHPDPGRKHFSVYQKILRACEIEELSDNFIFTYDDTFLLQPIDEVKYWFSGTLTEVFTKSQSGRYLNALRNTIQITGSDYPYFDCHAPIVFEKDLFKEVFGGQTEEYLFKPLYCYKDRIEGEPYTDLKIKSRGSEKEIKKMIEGRLFFSIGPHACTPDMKNVLDELYPLKSVYEY